MSNITSKKYLDYAGLSYFKSKLDTLYTTYSYVNSEDINVKNYANDTFLGKTAKAADSSKLNGQAASYYLNYNNLTNKPTIPSITNCVKYDDTLQNTNPFGGKKLYINSIDNAFASADKKFWVTVTKHKRTDSGVTYPYTDTSKTIEDDNYYVDGPVISTLTSSAHNLFNGSYEDAISCTANEYLKIRVMFGSNASPSASTTYFTGYPYGYWYLSFYYNNTPAEASQARVYNKYAAHTKGWHLYTSTWYSGSTGSTNVIHLITDTSDYNRTCVEFIIYGNGTSGRTTNLTQIEYKLQRPNLGRDGSTVTKYDKQSLYHDFTWYNNHSQTAKIATDGTITTTGDITGDKILTSSAAVDIANGNQLVIYNTNGFKKTNTTFDGSTTSKYLSKKGTFESLPTETAEFGKISDGTTTTTASAIQDTITFAKGGDLSVDVTGKTVTYSYSHPTTTAVTPSYYEVGKDSLGHVVLGNTFTIPTKNSWNYDDRYVRYDTNSQGLTSTQKSNARTNIDAGTYSKPSGGIPSTDLAESYYLSSNPSGYISGITSNMISTALGYIPVSETWVNDRGYYKKPSGGIPATDLAQSYYLASNPNGYTSNTGTVIGSSLTANYLLLGNGGVNIKASSYLPATSSTTWDELSDVYIPTMRCISIFTDGRYATPSYVDGEDSVLKLYVQEEFVAKSVGDALVYTNLNNATTSGFYRIGGTVINGPNDASSVGCFSQLIVSRSNNDTITQILVPYNDTRMYYRSGYNIGADQTINPTVWQAWKSVANIDDLSNYLPLSGGTINKTSSDTPLYLRGNAGKTYLGFQDSNGQTLGYIGVNNNNRPVFYYSGDEELATVNDTLKAKYHLGAFDTVDTSNADYDLITRKTGYIDLSTLNWEYVSNDSSHERWHAVITTIKPIANNNTIFNGVCNTYVTDSAANVYVHYAVNLIGYEDNTYLSVYNNSDTITPSGLLQYELRSDLQYTEKVIKNQPINTLDVTGSEFVRKEWEKSSNLIPSKDNYELYRDANNYALAFKPTHAGTYTIKVYGNNLLSLILAYWNNYTFGSATDGNLAGYYRNSTNVLTFTITESDLSKTLGFFFEDSAGWIYNYDNYLNYDIILTESDHAYPYQEYHQAKHIIDEEALLLSNEWKNQLNIWDENTQTNRYWDMNANVGDIASKQVSSNWFCSTNLQPCERGTNYSISMTNKLGYYVQFVWYDMYNQFISATTVDNRTLLSPSRTVQSPGSASWFGLNVAVDEYGGTSTYQFDIMIVKGTKSYPYQSYSGKILHTKTRSIVDLSQPAGHSTGHSNALLYRNEVGLNAGIYYHNTGDESVVFANQYNHAGWMFANDINPLDYSYWANITPALHIKDHSVGINTQVPNGGFSGLYVKGNNSNTPIWVESTGASDAYIKFVDSSSIALGSLGVNSSRKPEFVTNGNNHYEILTHHNSYVDVTIGLSNYIVSYSGNTTNWSIYSSKWSPFEDLVTNLVSNIDKLISIRARITIGSQDVEVQLTPSINYASENTESFRKLSLVGDFPLFGSYEIRSKVIFDFENKLFKITGYNLSSNSYQLYNLKLVINSG